MERRDLVVVGASAGGVETLRDLVQDLPPDFPAAVLVVLHLPSDAFSALPAILARAGPLPATTAEDGATIEYGRVIVAPPDHHLVVRGSQVSVARGPKENGHRPAIDPLFRSAARWHGPRTIGLILSGTLDDGAAGLLTIQQRGGVGIVQDPGTALYAGMPRAALRAVPDAYQVDASEIAPLLVKLVSEEAAPDDPPAPAGDLVTEIEIAEMVEGALAEPDRPGEPAAMTCPDCNGAMFQFDDGSVIRYRCRVGHAWSPQSLMVQQTEAAEAAMWAAIRVLEERAALHRSLADRSVPSRRASFRDYHIDRAEEAARSAALLREMLRQPLIKPPAISSEPH